jgi:hypothetical protein
MTVARDLLTESGSIFVQIGDENVHRVRAVMEEVFGENNCIAQIAFQKTSSSSSDELSEVFDYILWFGKNSSPKYRSLFQLKSPGEEGATYPVAPGAKLMIKVNGVDVFKPQTGEVISHGADGIACWFIDTDYNEESFFVRHAYFLGANDPYSALKTTLKAEIDKEAWDTLNSDTSRPFAKPKSGRVAVKVINHLGDEVMKVFRVY